MSNRLNSAAWALLAALVIACGDVEQRNVAAPTQGAALCQMPDGAEASCGEVLAWHDAEDANVEGSSWYCSWSYRLDDSACTPREPWPGAGLLVKWWELLHPNHDECSAWTVRTCYYTISAGDHQCVVSGETRNLGGPLGDWNARCRRECTDEARKGRPPGTVPQSTRYEFRVSERAHLDFGKPHVVLGARVC